MQPEIRYCFYGEMGVGDKNYKEDILLTKNGVKPWKRETEHRVSLKDVGWILAEKPEVVVFGTGFAGCLFVPDELKSYMREQGIDSVIMPTGQAWEFYNKQLGHRKIAACMHLLC